MQTKLLKKLLLPTVVSPKNEYLNNFVNLFNNKVKPTRKNETAIEFLPTTCTPHLWRR